MSGGGGEVQPMRKVQLFHGKHVTVNVYVTAGIYFFHTDVLPAQCCSTGNSNQLKEMKSFYVLLLRSSVMTGRNAAGAR